MRTFYFFRMPLTCCDMPDTQPPFSRQAHTKRMSRKDVKKGKRRLARAGVGERGELVKRQGFRTPAGINAKPFHRFRRHQPLEGIA